jgi:hypothetical protein
MSSVIYSPGSDAAIQLSTGDTMILRKNPDFENFKKKAVRFTKEMLVQHAYALKCELEVCKNKLQSQIEQTEELKNENLALRGPVIVNKENLSEGVLDSGSEHYKHGVIEPVEYIFANGMGIQFAIGNVIKYVTRYPYSKNKNKVDDLKKAIHYIRIILAKEHGE